VKEVSRYRSFQRRLRARLFYRGDRYECVFCGRAWSRFIHGGARIDALKELGVVGAGYRENARCPACRSTDRERLLYIYLSRKTDVMTKGGRVLHVAPEPNLRSILERCERISYFTTDLSYPTVDVRANIEHIPLADEAFDVVICNHVLEHVPDDSRAMREILRVLRPGGWAILQVPVSLALDTTREDSSITDRKERERAFGQSDHARLYVEGDYLERLERAGFVNRPVRLVEELGRELFDRHRLLPEETIYRCEKPL
jgi:SAM-dependent methyltransferase